MTFEETITAFRKGTLELDVPRVTLRRAGNPKDELLGPGTFRQNADGLVEIKCHVSFDNPQVVVDLMNRAMRSEAGALFADDAYYEAKIVDASGAEWDAGKVIIDETISLPMMAGTLKARPKCVQRKDLRQADENRLELYFLDQKRQDWEALIGTSAKAVLGGFGALIAVTRDHDDQIRVTATSEHVFPAAFERHLIEALQFVVGQSLHSAIVDEVGPLSRTVSLYGAASHLRRVHAFPPLEIQTSQYSAQILDLLHCYLRYLASLPDEGVWSAPSGFLSLLRRSSESSIDGWMIGLCVAAEGMAGMIEFEPPALAEELKKFRDHVEGWIDADKPSDGNRKRIEGLIAQLDSVRPRDRMMNLVAQGKLIEDDVKAWTKARNRAVHTRKAKAADLERDSLQRRIDDMHRVYRLLHSIVFHVIGYQGCYTDYAERGFPVRRYPDAGE